MYGYGAPEVLRFPLAYWRFQTSGRLSMRYACLPKVTTIWFVMNFKYDINEMPMLVVKAASMELV